MKANPERSQNNSKEQKITIEDTRGNIRWDSIVGVSAKEYQESACSVKALS